MSGTPPLVPDPDSPGAEKRMKRGRRKDKKRLSFKREGRKSKKGKKENDKEEKINGLRGKKKNCVTSLLMSEY